MTKRKGVKKGIEPAEFAAIESKLEAAFRSLPFWSPEPDDLRTPVEWTLPDLVRELAMLRNSEQRDYPWDATNRKLEGMKKYAHALLEDKLGIAGLPLQTRLLIASVASLEISKPSSSPDGRPKKILARKVAEITAERFFQLTGNRPTRRTAGEGSKDAVPGEAYGPFIDLLNRVYEILGIEASAASQAARAIRFLNQKHPQKSGT